MATRKSNFLKKYYLQPTSRNAPVSNAGNGVGIPAGGIGGGDGAKDKIGREKIPWQLSDFRGQPSMAADAGFSSIVYSRINKGRDKMLDPSPMFPDQDVKELDEVDNYISGINNRDAEDMKDRYFKEDRMVDNSKYSLQKLSKIMEEDIDWRRFVPNEIESSIDMIDDNYSWRDIVPDSMEDNAEAAMSAVSNVLKTAEETGTDAVELLSNKIEDLTQDAVDFDDVKKVALEIGRDFLALTAAGIPVIGTPLAASFVLYNMSELDSAYGKSMKAIDNLVVKGTQQDILSLQRVSGEMFDDYIDMMQASTYLIPFVGTAKGIIGAAGRMLGKTRSISAASFVGLSGGSVLKSAVKSQILLSPIFKFIVELAESEVPDSLGIEKTRFYNVIVKTPGSLSVISDIIEEAQSQLKAWTESGSPGTFKFNSDPIGASAGDISSASERLSDDDYKSGLSSWIEEEIEIIKNSLFNNASEFDQGSPTIYEEKEMSREKRILREFIRESIYHTAQPQADSQPSGWEYRNPPSSDTTEDNIDSMGSGKDLVNIKTDMGYSRYQSRPEEDLKEQALRRIIRRKLKILESKKKK